MKPISNVTVSLSTVAFFYKQDTTFESSSMDPYMIGFRHSRPNEVLTSTEGPALTDPDERSYQHPQYLRDYVPYSSMHEHYGLGIVLLEIGLWKPLMKMGRFNNLTIEKLSERLLDTVVPRLGQSMGVVYRDVVFALLSSKFADGNSQDEKGRKAQLWFDDVVLNELYRLSTIAIGFIGDHKELVSWF